MTDSVSKLTTLHSSFPSVTYNIFLPPQFSFCNKILYNFCKFTSSGFFLKIMTARQPGQFHFLQILVFFIVKPFVSKVTRVRLTSSRGFWFPTGSLIIPNSPFQLFYIKRTQFSSKAERLYQAGSLLTSMSKDLTEAIS